MADPMRVRATENGGVVDVKILMKHDMESGQRKDAAGKVIPAWVVIFGKSCKRIRLPFSPWHEAHEKSIGPPSKKKARLPKAIISFSLGWVVPTLIFLPFESVTT